MTDHFLVLGVAVVLVISALIYFYRRYRGASSGDRKLPVGFGKRAGAQGFRGDEIRLLGRIAGDMAPDDPADLLDSAQGRQLLLRGLERQMRRDERRLELGRDVREKLGRMDEGKFQEREAERLEVDLPVWIVEKTLVDDENEDDDLLTPSARVEGRLLDISEKGAAIRAGLAVAAGDVVEFWAAEVDVQIPATTAGVVHVQLQEDGAGQTLHLHFANPLLLELRAVLEGMRQRLPGQGGE